MKYLIVVFFAFCTFAYGETIVTTSTDNGLVKGKDIKAFINHAVEPESKGFIGYNTEIISNGLSYTYGYIDYFTRENMLNGQGHWGYYIGFNADGTHDISNPSHDLTGFMCVNDGAEKINDGYFFSGGEGGAWAAICVGGKVDYVLDCSAADVQVASINLGEDLNEKIRFGDAAEIREINNDLFVINNHKFGKHVFKIDGIESVKIVKNGVWLGDVNSRILIGKKDGNDNSALYVQGKGNNASYLVVEGTGPTSTGVIVAQHGGEWNNKQLQIYHDGQRGFVRSNSGSVVLASSNNVTEVEGVLNAHDLSINNMSVLGKLRELERRIDLLNE